MPVGSWLTYLHPQAGMETPAGLRLVIGAVSGAGLSLSYAGLYLSIYSWICVGILLFALFGARPRVAFACGFLHGLLFVLTSVPWISTVLTIHGGLSVAGGWGVLLLIAMAWGVLTGTFAWAVHRLTGRSIQLACLGAPFIWVTFEFVRAHLPEISFPWNLLGYPASANLGLLQVTTITGIYGLSFLVASFNALLAWTGASNMLEFRRRFTLAAAATATLLMVLFIGPRLVPLPQAHHYARAVQLNFPESSSYPLDWFQTHAADLAEIGRISLAPASQKPDLLVWPEAPAPFSFQDSQFAKIASTLAIQFGHPFLAGAIEWKALVDPSDAAPPGRLMPYNSALLFDVFICYEAIYPGEVRKFAENGAQLFINISNDGWFGRSAAPEQHLHMARVRAVENRRWIVRSTNNGYTVSVDPYGRVFEPLPPDVRAAAELPYDFRTDKTIYTRFGDWFAWLCALVSVILVGTTFRKAK